MDVNTLVTVTQAARLMGTQADTIRKRIQRGSLEACRVGPLWLVSKPALEGWRPRTGARRGNSDAQS